MEIEKKMNLVTEPWIPVIDKEGEYCTISLMDVFTQGDQYSDLTVRPHERISLMRLFICIAHAALNGPTDYDEWLEVHANLPSAAKKYLEQWKDSFWLFHPQNPFLQIAGLDENIKSVPVTKLDFALATGNNTTLFDHEANSINKNRTLIAQELAVNLITYQNFSPGGGLPIVKWKNIETNNIKNPDAPCVTSSMLHTFIRGKDLIQTIYKNLPMIELISLPRGNPYWEMIPNSPDDTKAIDNATKTYLGRLVPVSRWIKFLPDQVNMLCGNGFKYQNFNNGFQEEPSASVIIKKTSKGNIRALLTYKSNRLIWRDLSALTVKRKYSQNGGYGPLCIENIQENESSCDIQVLAISRNQAKILDSVDSVYSISGKMLSPNGRAIYDSMVKDAEKIDYKLGNAIMTYRKIFDGGWEGRLKGAGKNKKSLIEKLKNKALIHYWTILENHKHLLMEAVESVDNRDEVDRIKEVWRKKIYQTALESYQLVCEQETPRGMMAFALGWKELTGRSQKDKKNTKRRKK